MNTKRNIKRVGLLSLGLFLLVAGCGGDTAATRQIGVTFSGLEPLGSGYVYEAWLIVDGAPVSGGRFTLNAGQTTVALTAPADQADGATAFVLTIEPAAGDDPAPAKTHVLAGTLSGGGATLSAAHPAALGDDFLDAAGSYILETPSTATVADDFDQGIWYLDPTGPGASLDLPTLPEGWAYEGWIATAGGPISTGRFLSVSAADLDGTGPDAGPDSGPPFPGQDFIDPALVLIGTTAVISIEPEPDDSAAPFAFKPLVDEVGSVAAAVPQTMSNNAVSFPSGSVTLK
jgi:hypothetical protein